MFPHRDLIEYFKRDGRKRTILIMTLIIMASSFLLNGIFGGFRHEDMKFKALIVTIAVVLLFQCIIGDIVVSLFQALYVTFLGSKSGEQKTQHATYAGSSSSQHNRSDYLQVRIASLKSIIFLPPKHRDEGRNLKYKLIVKELWLYSKYFVLLLLLVVGTLEPLAYYNTYFITSMFTFNSLNLYSLRRVTTIDKLYDFTEDTIIMAFNEARGYDGLVIEEAGWVQYHMSKLLGVVRLRQLRFPNKTIGLQPPKFSQQPHKPGWQLPYERLHYLKKYWRIYDPWVSQRSTGFGGLLVSNAHYGYLHVYPEHHGYVALLARNRPNSLKILNYLKEYRWLDERTAAVFFDFTLYSADANLFSISNIMVEQTPFGTIKTHVDVRSAQLLMNLSQPSLLSLILLLLYILQLIQFTKVLFLKVWFQPSALHSAWNQLDLAIVLLNFAVFLMIWVRESIVTHLMERFEASKKLEFVDFRIPAQIDNLMSFVVGLLICFTTLRIWKTLQFAGIFRTFTRTLSRAKSALLSTTFLTLLFIIAFSTSCYVINGNSTESFTRFVRSFTSSMCFSFGFSSQVRPHDLSYGGNALGIILYALLMFVVAILLINFLITIICYYFNAAKAEADAEQTRDEYKLSFVEFLKMEYATVWNYVKALPSKYKKNKQTTITEDTERATDKLKTAIDAETAPSAVSDEPNPQLAKELENEKIKRLSLIGSLLNMQMELLERKLIMADIPPDSDDEEPSEVQLTKNLLYKERRKRGYKKITEIYNLFQLYTKLLLPHFYKGFIIV